MSKNPYFAHLPTWRNRQDLAYALDNLPRILETMTASSPLIATYSYPSTNTHSMSASPNSSSISASSTCSPSASPSSTLNSSSGFPISSSSYTSSGRASPSIFRERFMLDVAKECHKSQSRSPDSSTQNTLCPSRRVSTSSTHSQTGSISNGNQCNGTDNNNNNNNNPYYPMQFSTRAKAMSYLIEILQSLQKEPCGCDLTKGCYCGVDGIEDHEGKSPCYVCGEWFPDRWDNGTGGDQAQTSQGQEQQGQGGQYGQRQGRAWHEQGSLRHHVAESRVKKWLDSVFRPPLTPATSPEQENVRQFGVDVNQESLRQGRNHQQQQQQQHQSTSDYHYYQIQQQLQLQQQQQVQYQQYQKQSMEPGRPWSFHDIELEARSKSRSRQNSSSSNSSISWTSNSHSSPQYQSMSGSGTWKVTASPKPTHAIPPSNHLWTQPPPPPMSSGVSYQARSRTQSCSDSQQERIHATSFATFTPPTIRPSSCNSSRKSSIRPSANQSTTFAIPQEILDPTYKSPTFRIKSWNPPTSQSSSPALLPTQELRPGIQKNTAHLLKKRSFDNWTRNGEQPETVTKSGYMTMNSQEFEENKSHEDSMGSIFVIEKQQQQQQGNTLETLVSGPVEVKASTKAFSTPFKFSFTSQRFRAAVAASIEKTVVATSDIDVIEKSQLENEFTQDVMPTISSILQSAPYPEMKLHDTSPVVVTNAATTDSENTLATTTMSGSDLDQSIPATENLQKEQEHSSSNDIDVTIDSTTIPLVSKFSELSLSKNNSVTISSNIRKSAPLSPLHYQPDSGNDITDSLSPLSAGSSPNLPSLSPQNPISPTGTLGTGTGMNKAASWTSLHRLVRKMTRNNDSLSRAGRMHLEGAIGS